jgi:hypothetical protein
MMEDLDADVDDPIGAIEIVRGALALAPPISPPPWRVIVRPVLALAFEGEPDRAAWIRLGVTLESIEVSGAAAGLAFAADAMTGTPPLPLTATICTISAAAHRLAACLRMPPAPLRDAPLRLAAHTSARLATAAAMREAAFAWLESPVALGALAAVLPPQALAPGVSAVGIVTSSRDDRRGLVRGGRAACRVWLEGVSLGLVVQLLPPLDAPALASVGVRPEDAFVAALSFGAAA